MACPCRNSLLTLSTGGKLIMNKRVLFIFILSVFTLTETRAQELAGGEIYYELLSSRKYKVTAHVYRQCYSLPLASTLYGYVQAGTKNASITFTRTSIQKINDTCGNPCDKQNAISNSGFEKHTFEVTLDFNSSGLSGFINNNFCMVKIAVQDAFRPPTTTHHFGNFYIESGVNLCDTFIKSNHSPVFSMEPKFHAACNQVMRYSPGPLDTFNYDSLAFTLEPIKEDYQTLIKYKSNFTTYTPFTPFCPPNAGVVNCRALPNAKPPRGFYFDAERCQIVFTPTNCTETGFINMRISEYRRNPVTQQMVLIGYTSREMLLEVRSLTNNMLPMMSTSSSSPEIALCGNLTALNITTSDETYVPVQTQADSTYISWDHGYKNGSLTVYSNGRERSADLMLPSDSTYPYRQFFTVATYDKLCNISLVSQSFSTRNFGPVKFTKFYTLDSCNVFKFQIRSMDSLTLLGGNASLYTYDNKLLYSNIFPDDPYTINSKGKIIAQYTLFNQQRTCNAVQFDTFTLQDAFPKGDLNINQDTSVCISTVANLRFNPYKIPRLQSIAWYKNDSLVNSSDSQWSTTIHKTSVIKLELTAQNGCKSENKITFKGLQYYYKLLTTNPAPVCPHTMVMEVARNSHPKLKAPFHYQWTLDGKDLGIDSGMVKFQVAGDRKLKLRMEDDNHCINIDSTVFSSFEESKFDLSHNVKNVCTDSAVSISAKNIFAAKPYSLQWSSKDRSMFSTDSSLTINFSSDEMIRLNLMDANGCMVYDSIMIHTVKTPVAKFPSIDPVCQGTLVPLKPGFNPNPFPKTLEWSIDGQVISHIDSFYSFTADKSRTFELKASNSLGCSSTTSVNITVFPNPVVRILSDTNYHSSNFIRLSTNAAFSSYTWFNGIKTRDNAFWASELGAPGKHRVWCRIVDQNGCSGSDSLDIFTDKFTGINKLHAEDIRIYPNPALESIFINVNTSSGMILYSLDGKSLMTQTLMQGSNSIDISGLASGVYVIELSGYRTLLVKE